KNLNNTTTIDRTAFLKGKVKNFPTSSVSLTIVDNSPELLEGHIHFVAEDDSEWLQDEIKEIPITHIQDFLHQKKNTVNIFLEVIDLESENKITSKGNFQKRSVAYRDFHSIIEPEYLSNSQSKGRCIELAAPGTFQQSDNNQESTVYLTPYRNSLFNPESETNDKNVLIDNIWNFDGISRNRKSTVELKKRYLNFGNDCPMAIVVDIKFYQQFGSATESRVLSVVSDLSAFYTLNFN
ncbi:hypothetical protein HK096_001351, partial [Nowakowskiella sp. JEL0078]